jgi:arylsulfatase A-like enzyme
MSTLNRREFCLRLGALSAAATLPGFAAESRSGKQPNIAYVLCDDLGWGDLDVYNRYSAVPTPNGNQLAREGRRFTDMHASSAVCTPSRYSILTGRYPWRTSLKRGVLNGYSPDLIEPGRMTVASMLKAQGYYTAGLGKWHLGLGNADKTDYTKPLDPGPVDFGFDYYFGIPSSLDFPPYLYFENNHVVEQPTASTPGSKTPRGVFWRPGPIAPHFVMNEVLPTIADKAVSIIHDRATKPDKPFFLYVAFPSPHTPWLPLPEYQGKSRAGTYGDYVVEVDAMLGRVVQALKQTGLDENTLLIFTSDNGADWKIGDEAEFEHRANGDWRGEKADVWEAGHRIPFIARWPGHIPPNTVSNDLGSLTDLMATVAAITGAHLPSNAGEDSYNFLPALLGTNKKPIRDVIVSESVEGMMTIRQGNWKLEEGLGSGGFSDPKTADPQPGGPKGQLYNLANDPGELHNLYQEHPEIVGRLTQLLDKYESQGYSRPM